MFYHIILPVFTYGWQWVCTVYENTKCRSRRIILCVYALLLWTLMSNENPVPVMLKVGLFVRLYCICIAFVTMVLLFLLYCTAKLTRSRQWKNIYHFDVATWPTYFIYIFIEQYIVNVLTVHTTLLFIIILFYWPI